MTNKLPFFGSLCAIKDGKPGILPFFAKMLFFRMSVF